MKQSYLTQCATDFAGAANALRAIERKREKCVPGSYEAEAGAEASEKAREIIRRMLADMRGFPVDAANAHDRLAVFQVAVDALGIADSEVANAAALLAVEAGLAARIEERSK